MRLLTSESKIPIEYELRCRYEFKTMLFVTKDPLTKVRERFMNANIDKL